MRPTAYQRTHRPLRVVENLCSYVGPVDEHGCCPCCGRWTPAMSETGTVSRLHRPNENGSLGRTAHYADGSIRALAPGEAF